MVLWFSGDVCAISTSGLRQSAEPSGSSWGPSADPWSPVPSGSALSRSQPWDVPPTLSSSEPWGRTPALPTAPPTTDPWAQSSPHHILNTGADPWGASQETSNSPGKWKAWGAGDGLEGLFPKGNNLYEKGGCVPGKRGRPSLALSVSPSSLFSSLASSRWHLGLGPICQTSRIHRN